MQWKPPGRWKPENSHHGPLDRRCVVHRGATSHVMHFAF
uniref:Uncharacterized protein n=1 Tax=Setaria italica TaxID=4555 RepID=K3XTL5_SETIT